MYGTEHPLDAFQLCFPYIFAKLSLEVISFANKIGMIHLSLYNAENVSHLVVDLTEISIDCRISFHLCSRQREITGTRSSFVFLWKYRKEIRQTTALL